MIESDNYNSRIPWLRGLDRDLSMKRTWLVGVSTLINIYYLGYVVLAFRVLKCASSSLEKNYKCLR